MNVFYSPGGEGGSCRNSTKTPYTFFLSKTLVLVLFTPARLQESKDHKLVEDIGTPGRYWYTGKDDDEDSGEDGDEESSENDGFEDTDELIEHSSEETADKDSTAELAREFADTMNTHTIREPQGDSSRARPPLMNNVG